MKKLFTLKNVLICILFTIFLLFVKDNFSVVWNAICMLASILTPFVIGFLFAYILNFPYKFFYSKVFGFLKNKKAFFAKMRKPVIYNLHIYGGNCRTRIFDCHSCSADRRQYF